MVILQAGRNSGEYASLSLSTNVNREPVFVNESYCAVYNSFYVSPAAIAQAGAFHPGLWNDSALLDPFGCTDVPAEFRREVNNHSVIVDRGNCTFYRKALVAQKVNASMLLVVYNETITSVPALEPEDDGPPISIPVLFVSRETGEKLKVK